MTLNWSLLNGFNFVSREGITALQRYYYENRKGGFKIINRAYKNKSSELVYMINDNTNISIKNKKTNK